METAAVDGALQAALPVRVGRAANTILPRSGGFAPKLAGWPDGSSKSGRKPRLRQILGVVFHLSELASVQSPIQACIGRLQNKRVSWSSAPLFSAVLHPTTATTKPLARSVCGRLQIAQILLLRGFFLQYVNEPNDDPVPPEETIRVSSLNWPSLRPTRSRLACQAAPDGGQRHHRRRC